MIDFSGATFDSRLVKPGMLFVALKGEKVDGHDYIDAALAKGAAGIVDGYDELNRLAREYRRSLKAKVIGITGSAGKTTTKELVRAFLSKLGKTHATAGNFNNHIGLPITILNCPRDAEYLVLEMGTNHPGEIAALCDVAEPDAGLITNVGTAHLEFFLTQDGIADEKGTLFSRVKDFFVAGSDNVRLDRIRAMGAADFVVADTSAPWLAEAMASVLPGAHNVANASIAFELAARYGLTREAAVAALDDFSLPGARWRRTVADGVLYVDDTYNANPSSMHAALAAFESMPCRRHRIVILGDMFELGSDSLRLHKEVFEDAMSRGFDLVVAVGETSSKCRCHEAYASVADAAEALRGRFAAGDSVLLKASHSMKLGELVPSDSGKE